MNTPSVPEPERPPADGTSGSADDDVPPAPGQGEPALRPAGGLTGRPDRHEGSARAGDGEDDDDEYEPL